MGSENGQTWNKKLLAFLDFFFAGLVIAAFICLLISIAFLLSPYRESLVAIAFYTAAGTLFCLIWIFSGFLPGEKTESWEEKWIENHKDESRWDY